jgi:hypothetical protein
MLQVLQVQIEKKYSTLSFRLAATAEEKFRVQSSEFRVKDKGELVNRLSSCRRRRQGFVSVASFGKPLLLPIEKFNGADGVLVVNGTGRFLP